MIARARGRERFRPDLAASLVFVASGAFGGAAMAIVPALAGTALSAGTRTVSVAVLAFALLAASARWRRPWQFDIETPTRWLEYPGVLPALLNGLALGAAFMTRLGFWLAWLLPVLVLAAGGFAGIAVGALYGAVRTAGSVALAGSPLTVSGPGIRLARAGATATLVAAVFFIFSRAVIGAA